MGIGIIDVIYMKLVYFLRPVIPQMGNPCAPALQVGFHVLPVCVLHGKQAVHQLRSLHALNACNVKMGTLRIGYCKDKLL